MPSALLVPPHLDDVARLLSDPSRLRMLWALGDGRAYTATELARVANLSAPAASNHLTRMVDAGFLEVRSQGRHRYFTLTREDIGRAVEAMAAISIDIAATSPKLPSARPALRYARRCYGHLAGECGVAFWDHLVAENLLNVDESGWLLNDEGERVFAALGIQLTRSLLPVRPCLDWTERRWHLGGALGRASLAALQDRGVVSPNPSGDRVLLVDPHRWREFLQQLRSGRSCSA
jgi:DNA-binding transcriptional ArsR family regulator